MKPKKQDEHVKYVIDMEQTRMKRWNLLVNLISIIVTIALIGLIIYGKEYKEQLEVVMYALSVILIVAVFAIVRRNLKQCVLTS